MRYEAAPMSLRLLTTRKVDSSDKNTPADTSGGVSFGSVDSAAAVAIRRSD